MRAPLAALCLVLAAATTAVAVCGDGALDEGEQCDDFNVVDGDCCSSGCQLEPAETVCRASAGPCDLAENCTGADPTCPSDAKATSECRAASGQCDVAESCDGVNDDCPADAKSTAVCRAAGGPCDLDDSCNGVDNDCPADAKSTAQCRGSGGSCDPSENCDGVNDACPPDLKSTGLCRAAAGECDLNDFCNGADDDCPADAKSTAACRGSAGVCDPAESCNGVSDFCPADAKSNAACRPAAGDCDFAESCDGVGNDCPPDALAPPTTGCRSAAGLCDLAETCTGVDAACPPDLFAPAVIACRPATDACDVSDHCTGFGPACPPDVRAGDGTPCTDGSACTQTDTCQGGACSGGNPVVCTPLDPCHAAGSCNPATGVCSNPARPDGTPCSDGNVCTTADSCQDGSCGGLHIQGCCLTDPECADAFVCTQDRCVDNACVHTPNDADCGPAAECMRLRCAPGPAAVVNGCIALTVDEGSYCSEDQDPCTIDACRSAACLHEADGSGPRCVSLVAPYRAAVQLLARTRELEAALNVAINADTQRLVTLLASTDADLGTAALALSGRLVPSSAAASEREPLARARLALGLVADTPTTLRSFLATLAQARTRGAVERPFARARRTEARTLLRGTRKLRRQLTRIVTRIQSFAR